MCVGGRVKGAYTEGRGVGGGGNGRSIVLLLCREFSRGKPGTGIC